MGKLTAAELEQCRQAIANVPAETPLDDWDVYANALGLKKTLLKKLRPLITTTDPQAKPVSGEMDKSLRDVEQVPLRYEGGIEAFMRNEVLPYTPDAIVSEDDTKVGYELSFTKYFYKPVQLRSVHDIVDDITGIEQETDGLLEEILSITK